MYISYFEEHKIYESCFQEKGENSFYTFLKNAPKQVLADAMQYWANRKILWNRKEIRLTRTEIDELVSFQKALDKMGIDNQEFLSHVSV